VATLAGTPSFAERAIGAVRIQAWRVIQMAERKLERSTAIDNGFFLYDYPVEGFSLKFVSGPELTKDVKKGSWLDSWQNSEGKIQFTFGPQKRVAFNSKETAIAVQRELEKAVDIITEVAE
jgi:hypothetical protein